MSCKIISADPNLVLQPVFQTSARNAEPKPFFRTEPMPVEQAPVVDLAPLRDRIAQLEAALERETRQARETGRREGESAGYERARAELQPVIERLSRSIADLSTLRSRIRQDSESELVKLSLCIARRVLRRELTVDPDAVHGIVKAALDKAQARDIRSIRVHPDFLPVVKAHMEASRTAVGLEIASDPSLQPGDVIVETRVGDLDASIESQLREIERGFADRLNR